MIVPKAFRSGVRAIGIGLIATLTITSSGYTRTSQTTYWTCIVSLNSMGADFAVTEVVALPPGISEDKPNRELRRWLEEVRRGRVNIGLSSENRPFAQGECSGFFSEAGAAKRLRELLERKPHLKTLPSPFNAESMVASIIAPKPPTTRLDTPSKPAGSNRAELVETPAGPILMTSQKKAEYYAKLAEHQRQLAEREKAIADAAARHEASRKAAEEKVAQHNKELAEHREKVAQMERDAAAIRAQWAQRAAGIEDNEQRKVAADAPVKAQQTEIKKVKSLSLHNSEAAALKSLLDNNGARNGPSWAPITNIQCSTVVDLGKQKWICTGEQARVQTPTTASGQ